MATGKPLTYENWNAGEPNNFKLETGNLSSLISLINYFRYENGEGENCLELWNRDGKVKHQTIKKACLP